MTQCDSRGRGHQALNWKETGTNKYIRKVATFKPLPEGYL